MIKKITTLDTFLVRHPVLRAGKSIESCYFDGDNLKTTNHFGYFLDEKLVGVASIYKNNNQNFSEVSQFQLRGMSILEKYQKKGFGEKLIIECENYSLNNETNLIWFNARINAVSFYEKLGYVKFGASFEIRDIGQHFLMFKRFVDKM